jgi:hypothetical protein
MPTPKKPKAKSKTKAASEGIAPTVMVSEEPKAKGRPTKYTEAVAAEICQRVGEGETLNQICRDAHMPARPTVVSWVLQNKEGFSDIYARAKELQLEHWADEIIDVADDATNDFMERKNGDDKESSWVLNGEHVQRSRLRVDSRKWLLAKLKPKVYGEGTQRVEVGKPGEFAELEDMSDAELADIARGSGSGVAAPANGEARPS